VSEIVIIPAKNVPQGECNMGNRHWVCGQPIVGEVWWAGEDYCDHVCKKHLLLLADICPNHRYTMWRPM
jgi:hypothetical protein